MEILRTGERIASMLRMARSGLVGWLWRNTQRPPPIEHPKFCSARDAVALIHDRDVVAVSGIAGQQRASILYWAIRESFEDHDHPAGITLVNLGGHGGRGLVPGTLEELAVPGLCRRLITSHFDTLPTFLDLGAQGRCELHCLPLGTMARLYDRLGRGRDRLVSSVGLGTFLDPRCGNGSALAPGTRGGLVSVAGQRLRYRMPPIDVALFNLPAADRHGNLYARGAAVVGDSRELARAARRNGGRVIANVGLLVEEGWDEVFIPAEQVDAVVYDPSTEQSGGIPHPQAWSALTPESDVPIEEALALVRMINRALRITPSRSAADQALARLAALTLLAHVPDGGRVNVGVGLAEEACRWIFESGALDRVTFLVESGPVGGLPAPGVFFGAAFAPQRLVSTAEMFRLCDERLDVTCLGLLELDGHGNVNSSRRGPELQDTVGPGGAMDLAAAAHTVLFVSSWMRGGRIAVEGDRLRIARAGTLKLVERVAEVTFDGARARRAGKQVLWVTHTGVFRLTRGGWELITAMPGIDVRRDVLDAAPVRIVIPDGRLPCAPSSVVTGRGFAEHLRAAGGH